MIIAAIAIGLLTAYYFDLRIGIMAAGASLACFAVAFVMPSVALYAYGAVAVGVGAVCVIGPKVQKPSAKTKAMFVARTAIRKVRSLYKTGTGD